MLEFLGVVNALWFGGIFDTLKMNMSENNQEEKDVHIFRAGHVLMHCLWVEKVMTDLIILKNHPRIIKKFNVPRPALVPPTMSKGRVIYWKRSFSFIQREFCSLFNPDDYVRNLLDKVRITRDMLSHSDISLGRGYMLYRPNHRAKLEEVKKVFSVRSVEDQSNPVVFIIDYSKEENYIQDFSMFVHLDTNYFNKEAEKLGIKYGHLR